MVDVAVVPPCGLRRSQRGDAESKHLEHLLRRVRYTTGHEHMFPTTSDVQRGTQDSNLEPPVLETGALAN